MRQFWLLSENTKDFLIDLQEKDAFGADPEGLGVQISANGYRAGTDIIYYNGTPSYESMKFTMVYGAESGAPYDSFGEFMSSINGQDLILAYRPDDDVYDPETGYVPTYLWEEDIDYPDYTVKSKKRSITSSLKQTFHYHTKSNTNRTFTDNTLSAVNASNNAEIFYQKLKVVVYFREWGTAKSTPATFTFTPGRPQTQTKKCTKTKKLKNNKKKVQKVSVKAAYNGYNSITYTFSKYNVKSQALLKTVGYDFKVVYYYSNPTKTYSIISSGDVVDLPEKSIETTIVPAGDSISYTIDNSTSHVDHIYTEFGVYAEALIFQENVVFNGVTTNGYVYINFSTGPNAFIYNEEGSITIPSGDAIQTMFFGSTEQAALAGTTRLHGKSSYSFTINYDGEGTVTIECDGDNKPLGDISRYKVTTNYETIDITVDAEALEVFNEGIYFRKAAFVSATKTEVEHDVGWLLSDLTLAPTTPWFRWEPVKIGGTHVNSLPIDTSGCLLFSSTIMTVPLRIVYITKSASDYFSVNVTYSDNNGKTFTSNVKFNKPVVAGAIIEINSDFDELTARYSTNSGKTWTDLMPYLVTSGIGFARVKANGVSYLDFKGTSETFNSELDQIWFRKEMLVV